MKTKHHRRLAVEQLESRRTPTSASVNYTDIDGDRVRITATVPGPVAPPLGDSDLTFTDGTLDGQLATLTLTQPGFNNARIAFAVTRVPGGDGRAHVGFVNAFGIDLDRVVVAGDLGKIVAGDSVTTNDPGLNLLQARSMGTFGLVTQGGVGDLSSVITGRLGALKVAGDVTDARVQATAATPSDGQIGSVFIGGDLTGGVADNSGSVVSSGAMGDVSVGGSITGGVGVVSGLVLASGRMGNVRVGGDIIGGAGEDSGEVGSLQTMGNVWVGGSLVGGVGEDSGVVIARDGLGTVQIGGALTGGAGEDSGRVFSFASMGDVTVGGDVAGGVGPGSGRVLANDAMGMVRITGDLTGGAGDRSGTILGFGSVRGVSVGGDVAGGSANFSGQVGAGGALGPVRIGGDLIGGSVGGSVSRNGAGQVFGNRIAGVTIGGSLVAGTDASTGSLQLCGAIVSEHDLGPVTIGGSILGNSTHPAVIAARGQLVKPTAGFDVAIASLRVGGDVRFAQILAGYDGLDPANADASVGPVTVGGDWAASSLVAGAQDAGPPGFGVGDTRQTAGDTPLVARIAGVTIRGDATGSLVAGDHFGFVAERIDKLQIGGRTVPLTTARDDVALPLTNDLRLLEVA